MARARDNSFLRKCFSAIVDRKEVSVEEEVIDKILTDDLNLKLDTIPKDLLDALPQMLMIYIKNWPGWMRSKEYYSGAIKFTDWYNKFKEYIDFKVHSLIQEEYAQVVESIKKDRESKKKEVRDQETQTSVLVKKQNATHEISISCPPNIINRLTVGEEGNDIMVKLAPEIQWIKITLKELLNWPFVAVELISPELHFTRKNMNAYKRYVCLTDDQYDFTKSSKFDEIVPVNASLERNCYTLNFLKAYSKQYLEILQTMPGMINAEETCTVIHEFLRDVEEIDIANSIATNTRVTFNIGGRFYVRTRRKAKNTETGKFNESEKSMVYTELLTPKMETTLIYFKGIQDTTKPTISFSYLNILKESIQYTTTPSLLDCAVPKITFKCTLCDVSYDKSDLLIRHFDSVHKYEPSFCCPVCMKPFSIKKLAGARWQHLCNLEH